MSRRRTAIVTGAATGIGRAIAVALARAGDHVIIADHANEEGREAAAGIVAAGGDAEFVHLDVARWADVAACVERIARERGRIDVAVANAGVAWRVPLAELDELAWDRLIAINFKGAAQTLRSCGLHMAGKGGGVLLAIASISARTGWPEHAHYNASKAGIEGFVRGLAAELGPRGVRANAILPGVIRTAQSLSEEHSLGAAGLERAASTIPLRRVGEPADVADVAEFLCSDASRYITGQGIVVDGGQTISSY